VNKAQLKRLALELRAEVGLSPHELFDPHILAELYGVEVIRLSDLDCSSEVLDHFQIRRPEVFSGALVPLSDGSTVIIENDRHPLERRVSTASHEISHVVLEHPFAATLLDGNGCRLSTPEHEQEAAELSGELLLPFEACKRLAFFNTSDEEAADKFGVSVEFARWRLNSTGARKIADRARKKRG
jgi:Zn-dependent peptidase ImmA (M78 family)